ncbi:hypothetical protein [Streptomyces endophytica]|uniref:Integral membrane protein n=1 Tax=Streptomyces endophytica TaxID=2991496 RepID=A0ABY6P703_9ACTN|nr:hypothetical protein [Streptomyces endophytica]UZJ29558.1 hypothetical protein OJ254_02570 [Streptomyces endophytica]
MLVMIGALLFGAWTAWSGLASAGVRGTPGHLTVAHCTSVYHHSRKGHSYTDYTCTGTFRADTGKANDPRAEMSGLGKSLPAGVELPASGIGDHDTELVNTTQALQSFVGAFACLLPAAFALFWLLTDLGRSGRGLRETWRETKGTATRAITLGVVALSAVGMLVVSPLLAFLLPR